MSPLGCICLNCNNKLLQGTPGREILLETYYNNVTVVKEEGCKHSDIIMSMYMQTLLKQLKMTPFGPRVRGAWG